MRINLIRKTGRQLTENERRIGAYVLLNAIDGVSEADRRGWRRFLQLTMRNEPGTVTAIEVKVERMKPSHRRHFLLESRVFKAQESFVVFDAFRDWLKLGSGFVEWHSRDGKLTPVPKSMAWDECEEVEFRAVHDACVQHLKSERAAQQLWPHLTTRGAQEMIDGLLHSLDE